MTTSHRNLLPSGKYGIEVCKAEVPSFADLCANRTYVDRCWDKDLYTPRLHRSLAAEPRVPGQKIALLTRFSGVVTDQTIYNWKRQRRCRFAFPEEREAIYNVVRGNDEDFVIVDLGSEAMLLNNTYAAVMLKNNDKTSLEAIWTKNPLPNDYLFMFIYE